MKTSKNKIKIQGEHRDHNIIIYTLSSCSPCEEAMQCLESRDIKYDHVNIDTASPEEREGAATVFGEDLPTTGMHIAFPIIVIGDEVITGFDEDRLKKILGRRI